MSKQRSTKDIKAARAVLDWIEAKRSGVVRDVDTRLAALDYPDDMGTKVVTVKEGHLVAWFDSAVAARRAIDRAQPSTALDYTPGHQAR